MQAEIIEFNNNGYMGRMLNTAGAKHTKWNSQWVCNGIISSRGKLKIMLK